MSAPVTAEVLACLRATGVPVGDGRKPDGAGWQAGAGQSAFQSYLVLYPLDSQRLGPDAPLSDRTAAPRWGYQVTAVGRDRRSAETASDIAADALLNHGPVGMIHIASAGVSADESLTPPLYIGIERYRLDT